jgi:uncharacterized protein (DUF362 family)/Pyruvate/2-oxoacid:ferredoxin oxidoreductase delta subunit
MSKVILRRATYDYKVVKSIFFELAESIGSGLITKNSRVVIKPNLLLAASPDKAIVTHPAVVRAAAEYALDRGARVQISDSPALVSFKKIIKESGIGHALEGLPVEFKEFKTLVEVEVGEPFGRIEIAEDAVRADVLINLPKLKSHSQMLLTLGVKNLFGCIVGFAKPEWHLRTGVDRESFARLLVRIYEAIRPPITVLDGILALEGQGPGKGGRPRHIGVLMGGTDAVAVDIVVCRMLDVDPERLLTNRMAMKMGLSPPAVQVEGDLPRIRDFQLPEITPLVFGPPQLHGWIRRHLVQRPVNDRALCKECGDCQRYCPASAIDHDGKKITFDYERCIRCYCCLEVCPYGALRAKETLTGKVIRKVISIWQ